MAHRELAATVLRNVSNSFEADNMLRLANEFADAIRAESAADFRRRARRALQAERDYQTALHERAGSRYGAERRQRAIDAAVRRRDQTAKELGL